MYLQHSKSAQCNDCNECTIETTADSTQTTSEDVAYLGCRTRCSSSLAAACTQFTLIKLNSGNFLEISLAPQRISKSQRSKIQNNQNAGKSRRGKRYGHPPSMSSCCKKRSGASETLQPFGEQRKRGQIPRLDTLQMVMDGLAKYG